MQGLTRACWIVMAWATATWAAAPSEAISSSSTPARPAWSVGVQVGSTVFLNTQSSAPAHVLKPSVRLTAFRRLDARLELGLHVTGVISDNANYGLYGGMVVVRSPLVAGDSVELAVSFGLGLGTGPRILATDLQVKRDIVPWAHLGLDLGFHLSPAVAIRIMAAGEHMGTATLGAGAELSF